ncbi:DUF560 domain-containing protein [Sphingomonas gei]|uniref:DUF560 domain-containing protein n=2 Tax=Sphingomonas gei TaxID=1395960 RepID=A0A4S1X1D9_9SPHN|nr:DUF560 domain-containing protein [Sphingomonas gei]
MLFLAGAAAVCAPADAQTVGGQDTRLRLDQGIDRRSADREARLLDDADDLSAPPTSIEINGTTYTVSNDVNEMGQALYVSVMRRVWPDVRRFLKAYLALEAHDPMLVLYAKGALARQAGDLRAAEGHYRAIVDIRADFVPGQLELARILFENRKDRDALRAFRQTRAVLAAQGDQAAGVVRTVDDFLRALEQRRGWQGYFAIGPGYSSNLNQSSAGYACLLAADDGTCLIDRTMPAPIKSAGINFEGTINRRVPLGGNSGISGRALVFGDIYPGNGDFSQATLTTQLGYDYRTAKASLTLSPTFDLGTFGPEVLYGATGFRAEAMYTLSRALAVRIEASRKTLRYRQAAYAVHDGGLTEAYLTGWYALPKGWTLFGGPDFLDKNADDPADGYRQYGARVGLNKQFGAAINVLLIASYRVRDQDAYSALLEAKRRDREQNYTAILKIPALKFAKLMPSLLVQHNRVNSNVGWLYSYRRTTASMRLEYAF